LLPFTTIDPELHRAALLAPERPRDPRLTGEACALVTRHLGVAENEVRFAVHCAA
jgi:hypothetical protein